MLTRYRRFVAHMNALAMRRYRPEIFPGEIILFNTTETKVIGDHRLRMGRFAKSSRAVAIPGNRISLYIPPSVDELARQLQMAITAAEAGMPEASNTPLSSSHR